MAINPLKLADSIRNRFTRYLNTTFRISKSIPRWLGRSSQDRRSDAAFPWPVLQGIPPYQAWRSLAGPCQEAGIAEQDPGYAPLDGEKPLYAHQERAIRLLRNGENAVIASGHRKWQDYLLSSGHPQ